MYYEILKNKMSHRYRVLNNISEIIKITTNEINAYPLTLEIRPANSCNANCEFCICKLNNKNEMLDSRIFAKLIDEIIESGQIIAIVFSGGGEPSLHPYLTDAIIRLTEVGVEVGVITNGIYMSEELLKAYMKCSWIRISINSFNKEDYQKRTRTTNNTYNTVYQDISGLVSLRKKCNNNLVIGISAVIEEQNWQYRFLSQYILLAAELGIDMVTYKRNRTPGLFYRPLDNWIIDALIKLQEECKIYSNITSFIDGEEIKAKREYCNCNLVENNIISFIDARGDIYPCLYFAENQRNVLGNINDSGYRNCIYKSYGERKNIAKYCIHCKMCKNYNMNVLINKCNNSVINIDNCDPHWKFL